MALTELRRRRVADLRVVGHTDAKGTAAYNRELSRRRAEAVQDRLAVTLGAAAPRIQVEGRGEVDPVASNTRDGRDDQRGRARNRRVELVFGA